MRYEPVNYIYEYEIGALCIFLIIMVRYLFMRRFPNQRNRLFLTILVATLCSAVLDIASSLIIDNVYMVPLWLTDTVNTLFYATNIVLMILMTIYTYALVGYIDRTRLGRLLPLFLPGLTMLFMLFTNPFTRLFFSVDPVRGYVHGSVFIFNYMVCFLYVIITALIVLFRFRKMRREEYISISIFLVVVCASTVLQYYYPDLLVTGVAIIFSVVLMYFTIQKPDSMEDITTGAFTYEAMLTFLSDRVKEHDDIQLVAVKIHNMSRINDLLGIERGSLLLQQVCLFLQLSAKDTWMFRMRGSCLVAITRKRENYEAVHRKIENRIWKPWVINGTEVLLQATVCCIEPNALQQAPVSAEDAIHYLEAAFAQHEQSDSRIITVMVGPELVERIQRASTVEEALREALESGEGLELFFQPMWSPRENRFTSVEVLLRFRHPSLGNIPPDEFVAIAENNGMITALDELVVRRTCAFLREHPDMREYGIETVEVNLSALEFMHNRLPKLLERIIRQYEIDPHMLCFEVTETAATESFELLRECMVDIIRLGCLFALDDFGMGYANISKVIQLPFTVVKLDKSLLYGPQAVLEDMLRMFARIERHTVMEGVETEAQAEFVRAFGATLIQGYYYAKPMCGDDFLRLLRAQAETEARL